MTAIQPQLFVRRGRAAVDFYRDAFGATELLRVGGTDEHEAVVAQLAVGDAIFWVHDEAPEHGNHSPEGVGGATVRLTLIVDDPAPLHDEHGWRLGRIRDPFGHPWEIGHPLGVWPPGRA